MIPSASTKPSATRPASAGWPLNTPKPRMKPPRACTSEPVDEVLPKMDKTIVGADAKSVELQFLTKK